MPFEPLRLMVLTPAEILLEVPEADWIEGHLADGAPIGIYPGHAPLIAETVDAPLRYADAGGQHTIDLGGGILQVSDGLVTILICGRTLDVAEASRAGTRIPEEDARFDRLARGLLVRLKAQLSDTLETDEETA
jgi:F0F1-type ATP synthase epsilon subunit